MNYWIKTFILIINFYAGVNAQYSLNPDKDLSEYARRDFTKLDGLPTENINDVYVCKNNFLWICTARGLIRYDGHHFDIFDKKKHPEIFTEDFTSITQLADKSFLVSTETEGLFRLKDNQFKKNWHEKLTANIIGPLYNFQNKVIIPSRKGLLRYEDGIITPDSLTEGKHITSLFAIDDSTLIFSLRRKIFIHTPKKIEELKIDRLPPFSIRKILLDSNNILWIGTTNGLHAFDFENLKSKFHIKETYGERVSEILEDYNGHIWAACDNGLFRISKVNGNEYSSEVIFSGERVKSIAFNKNGILWIGKNRGLSYLKKKIIGNISTKDGLKNRNIFALIKDNEGSIWIGGENGIDIYKDGKVFDFNKISKSDIGNIYCFYKDSKGVIWAGTVGGILKLDFKKVEFFPNLLQEDFKIKVMSEDRIFGGNIIVAYYNGKIFSFKDGKFFENKMTNVLNSAIYQLEYDNKGELWIGGRQGLIRINEERYEQYDVSNKLQTNIIRSFYHDNDDVYWFGTSSGGLLKYDGNEFTAITKNYGLLSSDVWKIMEDSDNNLWLTSDVGIYRINKNKINEYAKVNLNSIPYLFFGTFDGMENEECNSGDNVGLIDSLGNFWIATKSGVVVLNPGEIYHEQKIFNYVSTVMLDGEMGDLEDNYLQVDKHIEKIEINFSSSFYKDPQSIQFRYMLEGYDDEWQYTKSRRTAYYANLNPSKYKFILESDDGTDSWNSNRVQLDIKVLPFYYETVFFKIFVSIVGLLLVLLIIKLGVRRIEKRNKELAAEIEKRKVIEGELKSKSEILEKINSELGKAKDKAEKSDKLKSEFLAQVSHEIRTPINSILNFSEIIESEVRDNLSSELKEGFGVIYRSGERLTRTIDLILSMSELTVGSYEVKKENIDLKELIEKLVADLKPSCNKKNLSIKFIHTNGELKAYLDQYSISQSLVNIIDNAIKYTKEGGIVVKLDQPEKDKITIEIKDTGIGIEKEYLEHIFDPFTQEKQGYSREFEGNGLGLALVKKYCDINNIIISVESEKGVGTTFQLMFYK